MSYSEGSEIPLNAKNPWKPLISGVPGVGEYYTSTLCNIQIGLSVAPSDRSSGTSSGSPWVNPFPICH